ncbi:DUF3325 domain-containing protein [Comamonas sp. GB3 AK4-5]|uniref:DUF3325 domain-containing protein n=1 Tax=Comamonas sp. GB3 AK4-5 TaxID=3231487 RepID=UPI00351EB96A
MNALYASFWALALSFAGMAALAFAMDRHYEQLTGRYELPAAQRWMLRCVGTVALAAAVFPCVAAWGATVGAVAWLGWISLAALAVVGLISAAPRWAAGLAWAALLAGAPAFIWGA